MDNNQLLEKVKELLRKNSEFYEQLQAFKQDIDDPILGDIISISMTDASLASDNLMRMINLVVSRMLT